MNNRVLTLLSLSLLACWLPQHSLPNHPKFKKLSMATLIFRAHIPTELLHRLIAHESYKTK